MAYGFLPTVIRQMSRSLNFTLNFVVEPDGQFGAQNQDGSWNGMVGALHRREADICSGNCINKIITDKKYCRILKTVSMSQ